MLRMSSDGTVSGKMYRHLDQNTYTALSRHFETAVLKQQHGSERHINPTALGSDKKALTKTNVHRLLRNLKVCDSEQDVDTLFTLMDVDNSGEVDLREFLSAFDNAVAQQELEVDGHALPTKLGDEGTRWRDSGDILWAILSLFSVVVVAVIYHLMMELSFILKPVGMAYFLCLLLEPVVDLLEQRPLVFGPWLLCHHPTKHSVLDTNERRLCKSRKGTSECCNAASDRRLKIMVDEISLSQKCSSCTQAIKDFVQLGKFPHWAAVIFAFSLFLGVLALLAQLTYAEAKALLSDENFDRQLSARLAEFHLMLLDMGYNIKELADLADMSNASATETGDQPALVEFEEILSSLSPVTAFTMDCTFALIMLVCMMFARVRDATSKLKQPHMMSVSELVDSQVGAYITLKFAVSLLTGFCTWALLTLYSVRLASLFGILSCVLNFIPNVGSLIAMALPLPIIICQRCTSVEQSGNGTSLLGNSEDTEDCFESDFSMWMAFILPAISNILIGNFVEPLVFGKRLNLTLASILVALTFWGSLWGIIGAILSVPLLSAMKILLHEANHPLAARAERWIREDSSVDEMREILQKTRIRTIFGKLAKASEESVEDYSQVSDLSI